MSDFRTIDLTPQNFAEYGVCGYKDINKHKELRSKLEWFTQYYSKGLKIKVIIAEGGSYQGMIEYLPGEYAHRPVNARGYLFIHCLFVGFRKEFKGKGFATSLLEACISEAEAENRNGVAVITRSGSFMADDNIFLKNGFAIVGKANPDFHLLALKFDPDFPDPSFREEALNPAKLYGEGLTILRSPQCPYTEKNVQAILETARKKFNLNPRVIELTDHTMAQATPGPFGTFCIVYNGQVISHHPISNTRFENIMRVSV
jgi:L-amino acid N-acyltransferase YncA